MTKPLATPVAPRIIPQTPALPPVPQPTIPGTPEAVPGLPSFPSVPGYPIFPQIPQAPFPAPTEPMRPLPEAPSSPLAIPINKSSNSGRPFSSPLRSEPSATPTILPIPATEESDPAVHVTLTPKSNSGGTRLVFSAPKIPSATDINASEQEPGKKANEIPPRSSSEPEKPAPTPANPSPPPSGDPGPGGNPDLSDIPEVLPAEDLLESLPSNIRGLVMNIAEETDPLQRRNLERLLFDYVVIDHADAPVQIQVVTEFFRLFSIEHLLQEIDSHRPAGNDSERYRLAAEQLGYPRNLSSREILLRMENERAYLLPRVAVYFGLPTGGQVNDWLLTNSDQAAIDYTTEGITVVMRSGIPHAIKLERLANIQAIHDGMRIEQDEGIEELAWFIRHSPTVKEVSIPSRLFEHPSLVNQLRRELGSSGMNIETLELRWDSSSDSALGAQMVRSLKDCFPEISKLRASGLLDADCMRAIAQHYPNLKSLGEHEYPSVGSGVILDGESLEVLCRSSLAKSLEGLQVFLSEEPAGAAQSLREVKFEKLKSLGLSNIELNVVSSLSQMEAPHLKHLLINTNQRLAEISWRDLEAIATKHKNLIALAISNFRLPDQVPDWLRRPLFPALTRLEIDGTFSHSNYELSLAKLQALCGKDTLEDLKLLYRARLREEDIQALFGSTVTGAAPAFPHLKSIWLDTQSMSPNLIAESPLLERLELLNIRLNAPESATGLRDLLSGLRAPFLRRLSIYRMGSTTLASNAATELIFGQGRLFDTYLQGVPRLTHLDLVGFCTPSNRRSRSVFGIPPTRGDAVPHLRFFDAH